MEGVYHVQLRRIFACFAVVIATAVAVAPTAAAQNNSDQTGLVNVSLGDVAILNNVNLAVAANVAATICGVDVPVAVLATQVVADTGTTVCETAAGPLTVEQATNGGGGPTGGGNNSQQTGLVNVSVGDVAILNNVNLAVAANVAATICDVSVPVAVLATQVFVDGSETVCETAAGPLTVEQAQSGPGGGGPTGGGNNSQQEGLVNVSLGDLAILNNVNLAVAANVAATVCSVDIPIAVLAQQVFIDNDETICETAAGPLTVEQAQSGPGGGGPTGGGNNSQQTGLVNVSLGDLAILNNVNLAVAANVAATVCDVNIPIAVLARQVFVDGTETICQTAAGPLVIEQAQ